MRADLLPTLSVAAAHDPNWFYSTLAQSSAAIVGLAGGFLAARLIARRGEIATGERPQLVGRFEGLMSSIRAEAESAEAVAREIEASSEIVRARTQDSHPQSYVRTMSHSNYAVQTPSSDDLEALLALPELLREYRDALLSIERADVARRLRRGEPLSAGVGWLDDTADSPPPNPFAGGIGPDNYWSGVRQQREWMQNNWATGIATAYQGLRRDLGEFQARLVPRSIYALLIILGGLTIGGVILPMFFLSANSSSSKYALLGVFIPLALGFVFYLAYEVFRVRQAADLTRPIF